MSKLFSIVIKVILLCIYFICQLFYLVLHTKQEGAQWLSGRVTGGKPRNYHEIVLT